VFDHVTIRVSDPAASERFYDLVFAAIEFPVPPGLLRRARARPRRQQRRGAVPQAV